MRTTNIRFQEKREEDDRAWDILHKLEELNCKSQSALVVRALNAYYDRHLKKHIKCQDLMYKKYYIKMYN